MFRYLSLILLASVCCKRLEQGNIHLALDCGRFKEYVSYEDFNYTKDDYYSVDSRHVDYTLDGNKKDVPIIYGRDPSVYKTERHSETSFTYDLPLKPEQNYTLILKFAELYFNETGKRVFNIKVGDRVIIKDFDIIKEGGAQFVAVDKYFQVEVTDEELYIDDELCHNSYTDSKIKIEFEKGKADLPKVDGIIVVKGGLYENSDFNEYQYLKTHWDEWLQELEIIQQKRKEAEDIAYWGPPPEPIPSFLLSMKGFTLVAVIACFLWLVIYLDQLPDKPDTVESTKIETVKPQKKPEISKKLEGETSPVKKVKEGSTKKSEKSAKPAKEPETDSPSPELINQEEPQGSEEKKEIVPPSQNKHKKKNS